MYRPLGDLLSASGGIHVHVWMCSCVCRYMWRTEVNTRCLQYLSNFVGFIKIIIMPFLSSISLHFSSFFTNCCTCIYVCAYACIFLNATISVCMILLICIFSGLGISYRKTYWYASPWRRLILLLCALLSYPQFSVQGLNFMIFPSPLWSSVVGIP